MRIFHFHGGRHITGTSEFGGCDRPVLSIEQFQCNLIIAFQIQVDCLRNVLVLTVQIGSYADILNAFFVAGVEIAITCNSMIAEEVLVFQIATVAPTEHLECDEIFLSRFQVGSQIKLCFQFAVFTIADKLSIYP